MNIRGYEFIKTSSACPEQYDVFKDGKQVGYLRLRHGEFRVDYPTHRSDGGNTIYTANPNGDGMFDDDERERFLNEAIDAIEKAQAPA